MRVFAGFFVMAWLLAAPFQTSAQQMTQGQVAEIEAEVLEFAEGWNKVWEENSCEKGGEFLHSEKLAFLYGGKALGHSDWLEACASSVANRAGYQGKWLEATVRVLTPDAAVFVGTLEQWYQYKDGTSRHYPMSAQMGLVERTTDGWVFTTFGFSNGAYETGEGG